MLATCSGAALCVPRHLSRAIFFPYLPFCFLPTLWLNPPFLKAVVYEKLDYSITVVESTAVGEDYVECGQGKFFLLACFGGRGG
jgi:hypothetical protein